MAGNSLVSGGLLSSQVGFDLKTNVKNQDIVDQTDVAVKVIGKAEFKNKNGFNCVYRLPEPSNTWF